MGAIRQWTTTYSVLYDAFDIGLTARRKVINQVSIPGYEERRHKPDFQNFVHRVSSECAEYL
jgi:hypothetical protein